MTTRTTPALTGILLILTVAWGCATSAPPRPRLDPPADLPRDRPLAVLTSEGGARSFDVAMYLCDLLFGEKVAQGIGRGLIIDWPPAAESMPALVVEP
ncbi:MAG: hypothetical protein GY856_02225 [bacterium]|nr:hypothetical protein [bacterium]